MEDVAAVGAARIEGETFKRRGFVAAVGLHDQNPARSQQRGHILEDPDGPLPVAVGRVGEYDVEAHSRFSEVGHGLRRVGGAHRNLVGAAERLYGPAQGSGVGIDEDGPGGAPRHRLDTDGAGSGVEIQNAGSRNPGSQDVEKGFPGSR